MKAFLRVCKVLAFGLAMAGAFGSGALSASAAPPKRAGVTEAKLPNGLRVLLKENHAAPVVCTYVWYRVGSRHETPGSTGLSHQLEHMLFKGTKKRFPNPGYIDVLVGRHGGQNNATTSTDYTAYYLLLPGDQLDLALRIEADRMTEAAIDPQQLKAEMTVVMSELEGGNNDNQSFLFDNVRATAYQVHPYRFPVIGTKFDVQNYTRQQLYDYYRRYYAPNNAVLVVAGDFDTQKTLARIRALWKDVPASRIPPTRVNPEPPQRGERRINIRRAGATAYLQMAYHIPAIRHPDIFPLIVLSNALSAGRSSRLYQALVETKLAASVSANAGFGADPDLFDVYATAQSGVEIAKVEAAALAEIEKLKNEPLAERERQKAKNLVRSGFVFGQDSVQEQAETLGYYAAVAGDWRFQTRYLERIEAVTAKDVQRVARQYLTAENRTVGQFIPTAEKGDSAQASGPEPLPTGSALCVREDAWRNVIETGALSIRSGAAWYSPPAGRLAVRPDSRVVHGPAIAGPIDGSFTARMLSGGKTAGYRPSGPGTRSLARTRQASRSRSQPQAARAAGREKRIRLANGLQVIVRENRATPVVTVSGFARAGSVLDPEGKYGLANLTAEMLTRGTTTRSSRQIAEETDFVGASLEASAGRERTDFSADMLTEHFEPMLGLLADCLRNPTFPAEELEKLRSETVTALEEESQDTATVARRRLTMQLYPEQHPFRHAPNGEIADVRAVSREDVAGFHRRAYRPEKTVLVIVGDVDAGKAVEAVQRAFGDWQGAGEPFPEYRPEPAAAAEVSPQPVVVALPDKEQADIAIGTIGVSRLSADYEAATLMNLTLGGDLFVGRVGKRIRDTEGLAYYAYTDFDPGMQAGPWMFRAGVNPANIGKAIASAREEIRKMAAQGVTASDLAWAKDHSIGALQISQATNDGIARLLKMEAFYGLPPGYAGRYPRIIRGLSREQVNAAAQKYLRLQEMATVIVGPPAKASDRNPAAPAAGARKP